MAGQVSQVESQTLANTLGGIVPPLIVDGSSNYPSTYTPGQVLIDYSSTPPVLMVWNGTTWVAGPETLYIALLTGDPSQASLATPGAYAQTVADIAAVEDTTAGYARQPITFAPVAGTTYPAQVANTAAITWGPYTAAQASPVQWAAMVTSPSGTTGLLKYMWTLPAPQQVNVSQSITVGAGAVILTES